jgi:hypothetical protein
VAKKMSNEEKGLRPCSFIKENYVCRLNITPSSLHIPHYTMAYALVLLLKKTLYAV